MGRKLIRILIILAIASVATIIATQVYWLNKAFQVQQSQLDLRKEQAKSEAKQFNDRVTIALTNVTNELLTINNDPAELFQAVKQIRPNYFTVAINDTVHPYLLESLLRSEFERRNIGENFEYGIYDCFTDSIVYGNFVALSDDSLLKEPHTSESPQIKWDKDGHYFGVFFPDRKPYQISVQNSHLSTWAFSGLISLIVFTFFAYAIFLILRQKRLSEMKTDFINNMTHELKTPISTISLSSEILLKEETLQQPERLKNYAQLIFNENQRLRMQVDKVLQLATLDKENISLNAQIIEIHEYIQSAVKSITMANTQKDFSIKMNLTATQTYIKGDPVHVSNIIHNLLDNAVKYTRDTVQVCVATKNNNGHLIIEVKDSGLGIPKKSIAYIFDKFYRVPTGNLHDVKGFGLGLYYVKQTMLAHKGNITVHSELGKGSTFTLTFPSENLT